MKVVKKLLLIAKLSVLTLLLAITFATLTPFIMIQFVLSLGTLSFGLLNNINVEFSTRLYNMEVEMIISLLTNILETKQQA